MQEVPLRVTHPAAVTAIGDGLEEGDQIVVGVEINSGFCGLRASRTGWPWEQTGHQRRRQGRTGRTFRRPCHFARQVAEGKAFNACLRSREGVFNLRCPSSDRIEVVEGWIDDVGPVGDRIRVSMTTADQRRLSLMIDRSLLEQSSVFQALNELRGRGLRVLILQHLLKTQPIAIESPHQPKIRP